MIHGRPRTHLTAAIGRRVIVLSGFLWVVAVAAFCVITGFSRVRDDRDSALATARRALARLDRITRLPAREELEKLVTSEETISAAASYRSDGTWVASWPDPTVRPAPAYGPTVVLTIEKEAWNSTKDMPQGWRVSLPLAACDGVVVLAVQAGNVAWPTLQATLIFGGALLLLTFLGASLCIESIHRLWMVIQRDLTRVAELGADAEESYSPSAAFSDTASLRRQIGTAARNLVEARLRINCLENQMQRTLQNRERSFARSLEKTRRDSLTDPLTGLYNRRFLDEEVPAILTELESRDADVTVVMIDLDHFKKHNDTHGHEAGDALLRFVGELLRGTTRENDYCVRYGGDEFAIIMPETSPENAVPLVERLLKLFAQYTGVLKTEPRISLSAGVAGSAARTPEERRQLIALADRALYQAKRLGKNRVAVAA